MPAITKAERLSRLPEGKPCNNRGMASEEPAKGELLSVSIKLLLLNKNISSTQIPFAFKSFSIKLY
jgi:hypothetical protein